MSDLGRLSADGELRSLELTRHYRATAAEVWSALTEPERIERWLGCEASVEAALGGNVHFLWEGEGGGEMNGSIVVLEPERTIEYTWCEGGATSVVRFDLEPDTDGVTLRLLHSQVRKAAAAGLSAGWHTHLDAFGAALRSEPFEFWPRYRELEPEYVKLAASL